MAKLPRLTEEEHRNLSAKVVEMLADIGRMENRVRSGYPLSDPVYRQFFNMKYQFVNFINTMHSAVERDRTMGGLADELYFGDEHLTTWPHHADSAERPERKLLQFTNPKN